MFPKHQDEENLGVAVKMAHKNVFPHELIGEEIEIIDSKNKSNLGIHGKIIDETKETIAIRRDDGKEIVLMKKIITFKLMKTGKVVLGQSVARRPEDRLKH